MKKPVFIFMLLCMGGVMLSHAQTGADFSKYDNVLYVSNAETQVGSQIILSLQMNNTVEARGFQCDLYLPEGMTFAEDADGFPMAELSTARTTAKKTDYFNAVLRPDGSLRILCNSTAGYSFLGNTGEVALITVDVSNDIELGTYHVSVRNSKISDPQAQDHSVNDAIESTVEVRSEYDEGYSVQILPFKFNEDMEGLEFVLASRANLTNVAFEIIMPEVVGSNQLYTISKGLGTTTAATSIGDDETGTVKVSITRKNSKTISDGMVVAKLELGYDAEVLTEGVYEIDVKNVCMTDEAGNTYMAAPYSANIFIGAPKAPVDDGKVTMSGDYSDETIAEMLTDAIPDDDPTITEVDLTGVTGLPENTEIKVENPNALIATKTDLGLANTKNVIIDKVCENLELTDGNLFEAPFKFTATNASYSRDLTGFGTICLPYAPTTDGFEYYELEDDQGTMLRFRRVNAPSANKPYLYRMTGSSQAITGSGVEISAAGAGEEAMEGGTWKMVGTYKPMTLTAGDDAYALSGGVLYHNTGTLTMKPFRAYFVKEGADVKSVGIIIEDETTGILTPNSSLLTPNYVGAVYNLAGQKVAGSYKGVVIRNGKKIWQR